MNETRKNYRLRTQMTNKFKCLLMIFQRMAMALEKKNYIDSHKRRRWKILFFFFSNFHMNEYKKKFLLKIYRSSFFFFSVLSKSWFIDSHDIVNIQTDWFRVNAKTRRIFAFDHQTWISRLIFCFNLKKISLNYKFYY